MTVFLKSMEKINKRHLLVKAELLPRPVPQDQKVVRDLKALKKRKDKTDIYCREYIYLYIKLLN